MASATKKPDLTDLTIPELRELQGEIGTLIAEKEKSAQLELVAEFKSRAQEAGIPISKILPLLSDAQNQVHQVERSRGKGTGKRGKVAPKYRNPADGATWSGRGRQPAWVQAHITAGGTLEGIAITSTPTLSD